MSKTVFRIYSYQVVMLDLKVFVQRLSSDLREILPEHAPIINVRLFPSGNHSWNTVMGANGVRIPQDYDNTNQSLHQPGTPLEMLIIIYSDCRSHVIILYLDK
ncbi:unnamed protein product [Lepeophtheirus salmonis]|uniref:(salmon louse) hypothetical protein n=1 Tax=Lepeophtheirus salmonis TaxID=72036 RepID=A0A7R8D695_LEPSM|nr:unnamed protein product [Lepeophtheirus salmonis]CAF3015395.1 unnamed protein product [Lepeophtheirus salmonis]